MQVILCCFSPSVLGLQSIVSERDLVFRFAICYRLSVCLSSVTLVHPTQSAEIFGDFLFGFLYFGHPLSFAENITEIVPGIIDSNFVRF